MTAEYFQTSTDDYATAMLPNMVSGAPGYNSGSPNTVGPAHCHCMLQVIAATQDACVAALQNGTVDAFLQVWPQLQQLFEGFRVSRSVKFLQHYILNAYYLTVQPCNLALVDVGFMVGRARKPLRFRACVPLSLALY